MDIRIDRLRLEVSGMSPDMARQFGRLVAERLGAILTAGPPASGPPASGTTRLTTLRVAVPGRPGAGPASLAASAAAEISRALAAEAGR